MLCQPHVLAVGLLASVASALPSYDDLSSRSMNETGMVYSFEEVPKSADLQWTPCYNRFKCANLEVPLDYANTGIGTTVVAFIRLDAINGTGQDILFNPGGPGGSGIETALGSLADEIMAQFGNRYNFVTFDPRGVNNSGIALTCYPENPELAGAFEVNDKASPYEQYSMAVAIGNWCTKVNNDTQLKYAGTPAVVQDMVHFTTLQAAQNGHQKPEESKIWYYGVSYGTAVGHTLAALYPERVGRIVVDGNVNSEEYYNGYATRSFEDTDKGFEWFFALCAEAGIEDCAFAGNSSTSGDIKERFDTLLARLEFEPVITTEIPGIVTRMELLTRMFNELYSPLGSFSALAEVLAGLERRNATAWMEYISQGRKPEQGPFNYTVAASNEALSLIRGIDASGRSALRTVDDFVRLRSKLQLSSAYDGLVLAHADALAVVGMNFTPPASQFFHGFNRTATANPVLFLSTVADPVTPASSAFDMAKYFEGSIVLLQNSTGHSTLSMPSACVRNHLTAYLDNATLPSKDTMCQSDFQPFRVSLANSTADDLPQRV